MSNIVCCIIFGFFIILGIADLTKFLILNIFNFSEYDYKKSESQKITLPANISPENTEYIIRNILIHTAWAENLDKTEIVISDIGDETYRILSILCKDYPHLKYENHTYAIKA